MQIEALETEVVGDNVRVRDGTVSAERPLPGLGTEGPA